MAVRSRGKSSSDEERPRQRGARRVSFIRVEWDSVFWLIAAFAMLYFTEFASTLLLSPLISRWWLWASIGACCASLGSCVLAFRSRPALNSLNWRQEAPGLILFITLCVAFGVSSFTVAIWPVWRLYSLLIVFILIMGFVSAVSLLEL